MIYYINMNIYIYYLSYYNIQIYILINIYNYMTYI